MKALTFDWLVVTDVGRTGRPARPPANILGVCARGAAISRLTSAGVVAGLVAEQSCSNPQLERQLAEKLITSNQSDG